MSANTTPLRAIRAKCVDCMNGQRKEIRVCPCQDCALWVFRTGHNPYRAGVGGKGFKSKNADSSADFEAQAEDPEA